MRMIFWILGLLNLANGAWMLVTPESWYLHLPAAIPDTGPFNPHFVRDIGAAFSTIGIAFCAAAPRARQCRGVMLGAAVFFVLHALVHVGDMLTGRLHHGHWLIDLPGVYLPAILLGILCLPQWWQQEDV